MIDKKAAYTTARTVLQHYSYQSHGTEYLQGGQLDLRCAINVKYTLDLDSLV